MLHPAIKITGLLILALLLAAPSYSQENTKGDKPVSTRENRFRTKAGKKTKVKKVKERKTRDHRAYKTRTTPPSRDDGGRGISDNKRVNVRTSRQGGNLYPQDGKFVNNPSKRPFGDRKPPRSNKKVLARNKARAARYKSANIYPQQGKYVHNPSARPREVPVSHSNRKQLSRLKRLQGPDPKPGKKAIVVPRSGSRSFTARKSINVMASYPKPKRKGEKAFTKDISGRKIRRRNYQSPSPASVKSPGGGERFSSSGRYRSSPDGRRKVFPRTSSTARLFYPQEGRFVINPSKDPRSVERASSNASVKRKLKKLQGPERRSRIPAAVYPRSASGSFRASKSPNTWAHFPRPKRKGERAFTRDLAGHRLRKLNYQSTRPELMEPEYHPYFRRRKPGDRPYKGPAAGYHVTGTRMARAWKGDIAGRKIRGIKKPKTAKPGIVTGGFRTATAARPGKEPIAVKTPGIGARRISGFKGTSLQGKLFRNQGEGYPGNIKARRPLKGGGSVSGRKWNNNGMPIPPKGPSDLGPGRFQGTLKARRPEKGGGSVSGKLWNNKGTPVPGKAQRGANINTMTKGMRSPGRPGFRQQGESFSGNVRTGRLKRARADVNDFSLKMKRFSNRPGFMDQGEEYTGSMKARKPLKGGGSVSGRLWNNQQTPIPGKSQVGADINTFTKSMKQFRRSVFRNQGETFTGNIKARRPEKGGGSISGRLWNNSQTPLPVRSGGADINSFTQSMKRPLKPAFLDQGEEFTGNIKAKKALKGGGSVSGRLWNNRETPLPVKTGGADINSFTKSMRRPLKPVFLNQGEEFTGNIKAKRALKGGGSVSGRLWNNRETPLPVRTGEADINSFTKSMKRPQKPVLLNQGEEYTGNIRLARFGRSFVKNQNASALALKKARPSKQVYREGELQARIKQPDYIRNKNSSPDALKIREPGKAFARAEDYQGNIKMKKFLLFRQNRELHPDAWFVKANKNNVAGEKDAVTNLKLWWARLFKKNDTQPEHLKSKIRKPRYDPREKGMWND